MASLDTGAYSDLYHDAVGRPGAHRGAQARRGLEGDALYVDATFPASGSSLYYNEHQPPKYGIPAELVEWNRIGGREIEGCVEPVFVSEAPGGGGILVSSALWKKGIYTVKFFKAGKWRYVHADDKIPCDRGVGPHFARSCDANEAWVMVAREPLDPIGMDNAPSGLLKSHAYVVEKLVSCEAEATAEYDALETKMVMLTNPARLGAWNGNWSTPEGGKMTHRGSWIPGDAKSGAGGGPAESTWGSNPQYVFDVTEVTRFCASLSQADPRWHEAGIALADEAPPIGFTIQHLHADALINFQNADDDMPDLDVEDDDPDNVSPGDATPPNYAALPPAPLLPEPEGRELQALWSQAANLAAYLKSITAQNAELEAKILQLEEATSD
ncbi:calcium-dependent cysteine-type endopeptidase [Aureococcus anophagefferens]|nr:calcium-dependent cysteine-type endopeptidase [Aureococcus anophagefferens]